MSTRLMHLLGWSSAILPMLVTLTLVVGEITDTGQRRWWVAHPLMPIRRRPGSMTL